QDPDIEKAGQADVKAGKYCTWETASGSTSTVTITNSDAGNTLTISITGAPSSGITVSVDGESYDSLNGVFEIPPNTPSYSIIGTGDFLGQTVTITNITNEDKPAVAHVVAQTTD
ncbi:MAG: hypothetical protein AAGB22_07160, partial [Bacteroidota bacterium]